MTFTLGLIDLWYLLAALYFVGFGMTLHAVRTDSYRERTDYLVVVIWPVGFLLLGMVWLYGHLRGVL